MSNGVEPALWKACGNGDIKSVELLLDKDGSNIDLVGCEGFTMLTVFETRSPARL